MTDPDSRLYRKSRGKEARLCYMCQFIMENRNGLAIDGRVTHATVTAERNAPEVMLKAKAKTSGGRMTVGEDKAYDRAEHVAKLREMNITSHVASTTTAIPKDARAPSMGE